MEQTQGIIIRCIRYSETSLIVHWITEDHGRLSTMARGALRNKSAFKGKLDLFNHCLLAFKRSSRSTLHTLQEIQLKNPPGPLSRHLDRFEYACCAAQMVAHCVEEDTPMDGLMELFESYLKGMSQKDTDGLIQTLCFECHLLELLGLAPPWTETRLDGASKDLVLQWMALGSDTLANGCKACDRLNGRALAHYLACLWTDYLGRLPKLRHRMIS